MYAGKVEICGVNTAQLPVLNGRKPNFCWQPAAAMRRPASR